MKHKIYRIVCTALCCAPLLATAQTGGKITSPQQLYEEGESLIKHITERPAAAYQHCAEVSFKKIYRSRDVLDIELAGFRIISTLLELMIDAVRSPEKAYSQLLINRVSGQYNMKATALYERIQAVLDYISGMTDVFALDLYRKINGNSLPAV